MRVMWDLFRYLETEPTARKFLTESYAKRNMTNPERLAFQQSTRFLYTWKQARAYYETAANSELLIRPLLLFYGCVHLLKGLCISRDPFYPQNSKVLQHGVTTRKIKKNPYSLLHDEVRPQKEGLFSYVADIFQLHPLAEKYKIGQLFSYLPDISRDYVLTVENSPWSQINVSRHGYILFPKDTHGALAYSSETFLHYLNRFSPEGLTLKHHVATEKGQKTMILHSEKELSLDKHPLFSKGTNQQWYFWNHESNLDDPPLPQWAAHYLLLYLLGTLCRYEIEHWGELVLSHSYAEIYLVEQFLTLHQNDFPALLKDLM